MNLSKLFLVILTIGMGAPLPMQAAGIAYKPAALMAAASTAAAVLSNGVIEIANSIKNEKLFDLSAKMDQMSENNLSLVAQNRNLKEQVSWLEFKNKPYFFEAGLIIGALGVLALVVAILNKPAIKSVDFDANTIKNDTELSTQI